jgi:hypothetical protein
VKHHCLHPLQYEPVCSLELVIHLRVSYQWYLMLDAKICTRPCELGSLELCAIVCEDPSGYAESEDYAQQELECCLMRDVYYWHCIHSLGEQVNSDEEKHEPSWCPGQHAHDVDSPNCK